MRKWIIPYSNPNKYDVDGGFKTFTELEWSQVKIEVGDLVYIYVGKPVRAI